MADKAPELDPKALKEMRALLSPKRRIDTRKAILHNGVLPEGETISEAPSTPPQGAKASSKGAASPDPTPSSKPSAKSGEDKAAAS